MVGLTGEVTGEVCKLLRVLDLCSLTRTEAQAALELKSQANFRERYLGPTLKLGLIARTIPDKPTSSKQKYRLTDAGKRLLASMQDKSG